MTLSSPAVVVLVSTTLLCAAGCGSTSGTTSQSSAPARTGPVAASPATNLTGVWQGNAGVGARATSGDHEPAPGGTGGEGGHRRRRSAT